MGEIEVSVHSKADNNINFVKENVNHGINYTKAKSVDKHAQPIF